MKIKKDKQYKHKSNSYARYARAGVIYSRPPSSKSYLAGLLDSRFCITCTKAHKICNWRVRFSSKDRDLLFLINRMTGLGKVTYQYSMGIVEAKMFAEALEPYSMCKYLHLRLIQHYAMKNISSEEINHNYYINTIQKLNKNPYSRKMYFTSVEENIRYLHGHLDAGGIVESNRIVIYNKCKEPLEVINNFMSDSGKIMELKASYKLEWTDRKAIQFILNYGA